MKSFHFSTGGRRANDEDVVLSRSATKGFNRSLVIGEGGFGCVYRGAAKAAAGADAGGDDDRYLDVVIKQLSRNGFQAWLSALSSVVLFFLFKIF
ncbi:hypothetical protein L1887_24836 [Cichorium endivia]|nr:hypothetical protein L1887_24836 [Cichorium endivia]